MVDGEGRHAGVPPPSEEHLAVLATGTPMMPRAEYLTAEVLGALWEAIGAAFSAEQAEPVPRSRNFLERLNPAWNVVGGVHSNLAEKRKNEEAPFAFATYTRAGARRPARPSTSPSARRSARTRVRPTRSGSSCSCCRCSARRSPECPIDS